MTALMGLCVPSSHDERMRLTDKVSIREGRPSRIEADYRKAV